MNIRLLRCVLSCALAISFVLFPLDTFAQWRIVNRINNGYEIQSVSEQYRINRDGNYIVKVKRYFPNSKYSKDFYAKNHVTNIITYEISSNLNDYRNVEEVWLDARDVKTEYDSSVDTHTIASYNYGWKKMGVHGNGAWAKIFRTILDIISSIKPTSIPDGESNAPKSNLSDENIYLDSEVDIKADCQKGNMALMQYIASNMKYPLEAAEMAFREEC